MLTLHLIRHGETAFSSEGTFCGDLDPPLAEAGKAQARRLAEAVAPLAPVAIYVSPMWRARQTAEPIAERTGLTPLVESGLREIGYGEWEGLTERRIREQDPEAFASWNSDPAVYAPPGGESGYAIAARALPVIDRIRHKHAEGAVVVVSHKATIRVITAALLGLHVGRFRDRLACPTASLTSFEFGERGAMLVRLGETFAIAP